MEIMVSVLPIVQDYTDVTKIPCEHLMSHVGLCYELRQLVAGFSLQKAEFNAKVVLVGFVV
jgi:hypothetical protein